MLCFISSHPFLNPFVLNFDGRAFDLQLERFIFEDILGFGSGDGNLSANVSVNSVVFIDSGGLPANHGRRKTTQSALLVSGASVSDAKKDSLCHVMQKVSACCHLSSFG